MAENEIGGRNPVVLSSCHRIHCSLAAFRYLEFPANPILRGNTVADDSLGCMKRLRRISPRTPDGTLVEIRKLALIIHVPT